MSSTADPGREASARVQRLLRLGVFTLAILGSLLGLGIVWLHLTFDPLGDFHAYYEAAARLNAGEPLYQPEGDPNLPHFYFYPPLLAILLRPLALLPYDTAVLIWGAIVVAAFLATFFQLGVRRQRTWLALGILGGPTAFALVIGQAQVIVTFLLAVATPWSVAFAGQLKVVPALAALYWLGRRDWQALRRFVLVSLGLVGVQLALDPADTIAYLTFPNLSLVGQVKNISPYAISPVLWAVLVIAGGVATLVLARTRWGWAAAVAFSVLAPPRLLIYMLSSLWAGVREPDRAQRGERSDAKDDRTPAPVPG